MLPERVGRAVLTLHEDHGVTFRGGTAVAELVGDPVREVVLADGSRVAAEVVVVGIGVRPATEWLQGSGLTLDDGVVCDATLQAAPGVWAVGDLARWRLPGGDTIRIEHWTNAAEQAQAVAAAVATGQGEPYSPVPYFWSDHYAAKLQSIGFPARDDEVHVLTGSLTADKWVALLHREERLTAVVGLRSAARVMKARETLASGVSFRDALDALQ